MGIKWEVDLGNIAAVLIALGALWLAWRRLYTMLVQVRANTLLALDQRYEAEPMITARTELRKLGEEVSEKVKGEWPKLKESERVAKSRDVYAKVLSDMRTQDRDRYGRLLQICGFFETVGYVSRANYIPVNDVINLFGGIIGSAGMALRPHIKQLDEEEGGHPRDFEHFLWLVEERNKY